MNVIWKYELNVLRAGRQTLLIPKGARFLSLGVQHQRCAMLWFLVDPHETEFDRSDAFYVVPTGVDVEFDSTVVLLGRVDLNFEEGVIVAHVFREAHETEGELI